MARNKLSDLNDHLFEQLERLNDESLSDEQLEKEHKRQKAMSDLAGNIIDINRISLDALRLVSKGDVRLQDIPNGIDTNQLKQLKE